MQSFQVKQEEKENHTVNRKREFQGSIRLNIYATLATDDGWTLQGGWSVEEGSRKTLQWSLR